MTVLLCLGIQASLLAQGFVVPAYDFKTAEDFPQYEQSILDACNWIHTTPVLEQQAEAPAVYQFVFTWTTGTPTIDITIGDVVGAILMENNAALGLICISRYTAYILEQKKADGVLNTMERRGLTLPEITDATYATVLGVIDFYTRNRSVLAQNKAVENYAGMEKKGKLKAYVAKMAEKEFGTPIETIQPQ